MSTATRIGQPGFHTDGPECLSEDEWRLWADGEIVDSDRMKHLESCVECQARAEHDERVNPEAALYSYFQARETEETRLREIRRARMAIVFVGLFAVVGMGLLGVSRGAAARDAKAALAVAEIATVQAQQATTALHDLRESYRRLPPGVKESLEASAPAFHILAEEKLPDVKTQPVAIQDSRMYRCVTAVLAY